MSDNYQHIFENIAHVAAPYVIYWSESITRGGLIIELSDEDRRGKDVATKSILVKAEKIESTSDVSGLFTRAVVVVKKRLQEELAQECDEPELRLWLAQTRSADFMNNEKVPLNLRKLYEAHINPPRRPVVRAEKKEESVPVRSSRGVPVKEQKRKPHCPKHEDTEMVYFPDQGKWKCPVEGCRLVGRPPKEDSPVGKVTVGRGQLDLRVVYPEDGGEPSFLLVADNNVALDVTALIDRDKFLEFNDYKRAAARGKREGKSVIAIDSRYASILLRFPKPAKVYGCEHS